MLNLLLRHIRRLATFAGGFGLFGTAIVTHYVIPMPVLAILGTFIVVVLISLAAALGLYLLCPRQRRLLEISGISAVFASAVMILLPGQGMTACIMGVVALIVSGAGLLAFLHSPIARKIGKNTTWRDRYSGQVGYPARLVWRHVIPGAAEPIDHCTGMMYKYDQDHEDLDTVHVTFKGTKDRCAKYSLTFLERDEPSSCRFFFQGNEADGTMVDGIFSLRITVLERDTCFVSCVEERSGLSLNALMERWFDNALGYQHDKLIEKLDTLYGETYGQSALVAAE